MEWRPDRLNHKALHLVLRQEALNCPEHRWHRLLQVLPHSNKHRLLAVMARYLQPVVPMGEASRKVSQSEALGPLLTRLFQMCKYKIAQSRRSRRCLQYSKVGICLLHQERVPKPEKAPFQTEDAHPQRKVNNPRK